MAVRTSAMACSSASPVNAAERFANLALACVHREYANASIVGNDRVVFNIKGNSFRLVVAVDYPRQVVFIKWVGSHLEYDRIDAAKVNYAGKAGQK
jgi:mRNA-degrading endonuclease HigB of HigAB toxin-antitoxin module